MKQQTGFTIKQEKIYLYVFSPQTNLLTLSNFLLASKLNQNTIRWKLYA